MIRNFVLILTILISSFPCSAELVAEPLDILREPSSVIEDEDKITNDPLKPEGIENFAASPFKLSAGTAQVPIQARLRIKVEAPLTAKASEVGDEFKAKVINDYYISGDFRKLIIPKNSWIRGKVSYVKKPRLLSRTGKLGVKLDTLITPDADYVPLDADLVFMQGIVNQEGLLDPQTGFQDKAAQPTKSLLNSKTGKIASVATLGLPVMGTLIGGTVIALFSEGDSASLYRGQELQIMISKTTDISL